MRNKRKKRKIGRKKKIRREKERRKRILDEGSPNGMETKTQIFITFFNTYPFPHFISFFFLSFFIPLSLSLSLSVH